MEIQISGLKEHLDKEHQRWRAAQTNYERQVKSGCLCSYVSFLYYIVAWILFWKLNFPCYLIWFFNLIETDI